MSAQVLVVEDEKLVAADLQAHLEKLGYGVPGILSTGEDAIRTATDTRPDLVLMDIQLKGHMDGIQTAQIMHSRLNIPVVYVTAFADERTLQRAKATDPYGYVLKPFGQRDLQTAIELALHKRVQERRVRSQEQWVTELVASIETAIMAVDQDGLVCMMNPWAERLTGHPLAEALGSRWSDFITFLDNGPETSHCPIRRAIEEGRSTEMRGATVVFSKSGRKAVITGAVSPMVEPGRNRPAAILVFRDITEWHHLETQYRRARCLEDMQRLAGGLAHQFSSFLTLISGCSESLSAALEHNDPRGREVRTIQKVNERASNLTRDLLAFSRGQSISLKVFDPKRAISSLAETTELLMGTGVSIERELDPATGRIEADPSHLEQILTALLSNSREAMPEGGPITIRTSNFDVDQHLASRFVDLPPGPYVRIDVEDRGVGMSYERQSHIFEPFFSTKDRSCGVSLAAAYGLVKQNRGHIWFESEPHKGTTFSVCLPRVEDSPVRGLGVPRSLYGVETILIADDDLDARTNTSDILLELGYRVIETASGKEALKVCERDEGIHLVLSAVSTPSTSAYELAQRLPQVRPGAKLLFMSAYSAYTLQVHGAIDPGMPIIQKPFTPAALAKAIRDVLA